MLKKILIFLNFIIIFTAFLSYGYEKYNFIKFDKYKQSIDTIQDYIILPLGIEINKDNKFCNILEVKDYYLIYPNCLIHQNFVQLPLEKVVNDSFDYIEDFTDWYDIKNNFSFYIGAKPIFKEKIYKQFKYLLPSYYNNIVWSYLAKKNYYIQLPKSLVSAYILQKNYKFYISTKDLSYRGECRKKNYLIAMNVLDGLVLNPGEKFNFNIPLAQISNYCKGNSKKEYMFYAGVCGTSSQLFRNALINPYINIVKRYNHSAWYVYFYDNIIRGDDASMYQMYKQFVIQNISDYTVYFKKFEKNNNMFLVSIIPENKIINKISFVIKGQTGKLEAKVSKIVFNKWNFNYLNTWASKYWRLSFER